MTYTTESNSYMFGQFCNTLKIYKISFLRLIIESIYFLKGFHRLRK